MSILTRRPLALIVLPTAVVVLLADQATKWLILLDVMNPPRTIEVTSFFNLVLTFNTGTAFGLFAGEVWWKPYVMATLAIVIILVLLVWLRDQMRFWPALCVGLITGGALGNVIDRFVHRGVVDFLDFHWGRYHWPAFNLADSAIVVGVALLVFDGLFRKHQSSK